jgi:hypothetical protein
MNQHERLKRILRTCFSRHVDAALRSAVVLLAIAVAGCATPDRVPELAPPVQVSESTWRLVDDDIAAGSQAAREPAAGFAQRGMEQWRQLVSQRAEADFIPWFSSYWTQQWLTAKVAWYKLTAEDGADPPVDRLAAYLQVQYHDRVLAPVPKELGPASILDQAMKLYIQHLGTQFRPIPGRYGVPRDQFERHLKSIPAIALAPPPAHNASLYQIVHADQLDRLPAYAALLRQVREAEEHAGAGLSKTRISPVAMRVSEQLLERLAISGGTSAASALVGGVAGTVISLGAAGLGVMLHEAKRAEIEVQLRTILNVSMEEMWHILTEDPATRVTAGIDYLSDQIGQVSPQPLEQALPPE